MTFRFQPAGLEGQSAWIARPLPRIYLDLALPTLSKFRKIEKLPFATLFRRIPRYDKPVSAAMIQCFAQFRRL
jgi:hypothetical protein